jgi:pyruvate dehydrogenase E1 component
MDEGNIFEACSKAGSTGCATPGGWSTTTARASTPSCARGCTSASRRCSAFGWDVVIAQIRRAAAGAFAEPGGEALRAWIDACPNQLYSALTFQGGAAWRKRLSDDLGDQGDVSR